MGLFSAFNVGRLALSAQQTALQVTGQNIANANNEAYTRQRVIFQTTPPMNLGYAHMGTGVRVAEIQRVINEALEGRIDSATSSLANMQAQREILSRIEGVFNALSDSDLSTTLNGFFDALEALTVNPEDASTRLELLSKGDSLCEAFRYLSTQLNATRQNANDAVKTAVADVNRILGQIAALNQQIMVAEGGGVGIGKANDLRDQRGGLLRDLSALIDVNAMEASDGTLNILAGGEFLVFGGTAFTLTTSEKADRGTLISTVEFEMNGADVKITGGRLGGLITARDQILTEFIDDIGSLAATLIDQMNRLHSDGQGLDRLTSVTSAEKVSGPTAALNAAGLYFPPVNGSFNIDVYNENTGEKKTVNIKVDLDGIGSDSTLESVVAEINAQLSAAFGGSPPVSAEATITNRLVIKSGSDSYTFAFSDDTSGLLSAMGINTFFTGHDALSIRVSDALRSNPDLVAASLTGAPGDNSNALRMAGLRETKVFDNASATFADFYQGVVGSMAVQAAAARDRADNQELLVTSLLNERERISGVNIDEETINLISYQRAYQAAARFIQIIDSLLETLINAT